MFPKRISLWHCGLRLILPMSVCMLFSMDLRAMVAMTVISILTVVISASEFGKALAGVRLQQFLMGSGITSL